MDLLCQIPYNFRYDEGLVEYLADYKDIIDSIYAGFSKGSRPVKNDSRKTQQHLKHLSEIKVALNIRIVYVMNSVIPTDLDTVDRTVLKSGIIDCVNFARDDIFKKVYDFTQENNLKFSYEISRFYSYIKDNKNILKNKAEYILFGFEHEMESFKSEKDHFPFLKIGYIANENCFPFCDKKLEHNRNVVLRNLGKEKEKFSCPYKEYRKTYSPEEILEVCSKNNVELLKICDRTMSDDELIHVFSKWFPVVRKINSYKKSIIA